MSINFKLKWITINYPKVNQAIVSASTAPPHTHTPVSVGFQTASIKTPKFVTHDFKIGVPKFNYLLIIVS